MRGFLFTGGAAPAGDVIRKETGLAQNVTGVLVAAADSGLILCRDLGLVPDRIIGDMDSLGDQSLLDRYPSDRIDRLPVDKDLTDTEAALVWLQTAGADEIVIIGGGEGRLDHLLALLSLFRRPKPPALWLTGREKVFSVTGTSFIEGKPGDLISFFPLGEGICRMSTTGLQWPLDNLTWLPGDGGVSNRMTGYRIEIQMLSGSLLCVKPFGGS